MGYQLDNAWSPWERIIRAADRGTGLRLSVSEIASLGMDQAITDKAQNDAAERVPCECGLPIPAHRRRNGSPVCQKDTSKPFGPE